MWLFALCMVPLCAFHTGGSFPKPLPKEEEIKLLQQLHSEIPHQRTQAQELLILHNLRLVAHIAKKYNTTNLDVDELISIGTVGLMKAIQTYDIEKQIKLASYAARCIENEILMQLRSDKKIQNERSLYEPIGTDRDGNELVMLDILPTLTPDFAADLDFEILSKKMKYALLHHLTKREQFVLCLRYGLGKYDALTQQEIAKKLGISRSYVSRIEKKALQKLQNALSPKQG